MKRDEALHRDVRDERVGVGQQRQDGVRAVRSAQAGQAPRGDEPHARVRVAQPLDEGPDVDRGIALPVGQRPQGELADVVLFSQPRERVVRLFSQQQLQREDRGGAALEDGVR